MESVVIQLDRKRAIKQMSPAEVSLRDAHLSLDVAPINNPNEGNFLFCVSIHQLDADSSIISDDAISYVWADNRYHAEDKIYSSLPTSTDCEWEVFALRLDEQGDLPR